MPWSNLGTGTLHYGKREFWSDGSYITTEFFALLGVAVVPLRSLRIKHIETGFDPEHATIITEYIECSRSRADRKQVASVFAYEAVLGAFLIGDPVWFDHHPETPEWIMLAVFAVGILFVSVIPTILRRRARKAAGTHK